MTSTRHSNSPEIFRKWVAIATIGAAMRRQTFILIQGEPLFCNLYVILVGPPGVGKTRAIRFGSGMLKAIQDLSLSPDSVSKEKFLSLLSASNRMYTSADGSPSSQTTAACFLDELSTFIRPKDVGFMTDLTSLYDCPRVHTYETIARGQTKLENVHLTLCGGITPKSIQRNWGDEAIGMGFTARLNLIYSEETKAIDLFGVSEVPDHSHLIQDLKKIADIKGRFRATQEAAKTMQSWVSSGMPPIPADSRFAEYNPRRAIHWMKLAMAYSIAESNALVIEMRHVEKAKATLLEAEKVMPLAFEFMGNNPIIEAINRLHTWMKVEYATNGKEPIHVSRLRRKLLQDVPPQYVDHTIQQLINSGMMKEVPSASGFAYIPILVSRVEH